MVSLRNAAGKEMLLHAPKLSLFRAATDNDLRQPGSGPSGHLARPERACLQGSGAHHRQESKAEMTCKYYTCLLPECVVRVTYTCEDEDSVKVTVDFPGVQGQATCPPWGFPSCWTLPSPMWLLWHGPHG